MFEGGRDSRDGHVRLELDATLEHGLAKFSCVPRSLQVLDILRRADETALASGLVLLTARESAGLDGQRNGPTRQTSDTPTRQTSSM